MAIFNIDQLREVEWDQGYLWEIKFGESTNPQHASKLTAPFNDWFPATTVTDERLSMSEYSPDLHQFRGFPFPDGSPQRTITVGYYDDMNNTLLKWVTKWVKEDILNNGKYLTCLQDCTKELYITKLNSQRIPIDIFNYLVIPTGQLEYNGSEHSESNVYQMRFHIVGESVSNL